MRCVHMHFPAVSREGGSVVASLGRVGLGGGGVERRIEQELAEAERSGAAGDRRSGPLLEL